MLENLKNSKKIQKEPENARNSQNARKSRKARKSGGKSQKMLEIPRKSRLESAINSQKIYKFLENL